MEKFIIKHNILNDCQFSFRAGRSPSMALLSIIENITTSLDDYKHAVGVFMDIKKAFDNIDDNILLERRMQPARGRFARFDLDRQMVSTFPAHWKVGPAPVFWASQPLEPAEWLALLIL